MKRLKEARKDAGVTAEKLAGLLGIKRASYYHFESHAERFTPQQMKMLCSAMGVAVSEIDVSVPCKAVRLTRQTAQTLVHRELGINGRWLQKSLDTCGGASVYSMRSGKVEIVVENDWCDHSGLLCLTLRHPMGDCMHGHYNPITLEEAEKVEVWNQCLK